ncbi:hypothetical protein GCM10010261_13180 [Streptomyces pilosus]|uniref:Uncharacterized protein n=1 Tax=Streptomyces pilosus TaxID=28893 RepID=A0A918BN42_9ACTN|nr:hypothetical protein GCM10010280_26430 [Streptomyces pilosus]GGV41373.1 hypothetical protein GCM10010261_13180 [Streptomyces pilosus]
MEVPAGDLAVPYGVGGQLAEDQHDLLVRAGAVRDAPGVQPVRGQSAGETRATWGGGETHLEGVLRVIGGSRGLGGADGAGELVRHAANGAPGRIA